jgi:predicted anti-sigma-YlaC factor YlaD
MDCREAHRRWHEAFDDRRPDADLEAHLAGCAACRDYAVQMSRVTGSLNGLRLATERLPDAARARVTPSRVGRPRGAWRTVSTLVRIAAVVGLVAVSAVYLMPRGGTRRGPNGGTESPVPPSPVRTVALRIELRGESAERFLTVTSTGETASEPVDVVWLYPAVRPAVEREPDAEPLSFEGADTDSHARGRKS